MPERKIYSELDKWFEEETILPSNKKLEELQRKLYQSAQWQRFEHLNNSSRKIRLNLSDFTEKVIPWIDYIFEDEDLVFEENTYQSPDQISKPVIIGTALHEAVSLFDLYRYAKFTEEQIDNSFPTQSFELIIPFLKALNQKGASLAEIWASFHTDKLLVDRSRYLLSEEFGKLPLSKEKNKELKIRRSEEVFNLGMKLATNFPSNSDPNIFHFSESLAIMNFEELSTFGHSRIQIPVRFDEIISERKSKNYIAYHFFDLKTGKQINDWPHQFQALMMEFLAGHFTDIFFRNQTLPNRGKPFTKPPIKNILPHPKELTFQYGYFNKESGNISYFPVIQDYRSRQGELFLAWLAFYSDAACALKKELSDFLKHNKPFDKNTLHYYQPELKNTPTYTAGFSHTSEKCDHGGCGQFLNQTCIPRQRGERKTLIWLSMDCPIHGNRSFDKKFTPNEEIYYPGS